MRPAAAIWTVACRSAACVRTSGRSGRRGGGERGALAAAQGAVSACARMTQLPGGDMTQADVKQNESAKDKWTSHTQQARRGGCWERHRAGRASGDTNRRLMLKALTGATRPQRCRSRQRDLRATNQCDDVAWAVESEVGGFARTEWSRLRRVPLGVLGPALQVGLAWSFKLVHALRGPSRRPSPPPRGCGGGAHTRRRATRALGGTRGGARRVDEVYRRPYRAAGARLRKRDHLWSAPPARGTRLRTWQFLRPPSSMTCGLRLPRSRRTPRRGRVSAAAGLAQRTAVSRVRATTASRRSALPQLV